MSPLDILWKEPDILSDENNIIRSQVIFFPPSRMGNTLALITLAYVT